ncbi:hypothetical protein SLEP1_g56269 [Rubroshorea leprosula]|uniref:Uncharacterized protein n=1 Tax=Rubroshorea leprosula TaxID=152421 RepID=A0AAV5MIA2_9ROSI|nr:hypothetical protein SLEP1_g56269 [Rubroshorea leprosula]
MRIYVYGLILLICGQLAADLSGGRVIFFFFAKR